MKKSIVVLPLLALIACQPVGQTNGVDLSDRFLQERSRALRGEVDPAGGQFEIPEFKNVWSQEEQRRMRERFVERLNSAGYENIDTTLSLASEADEFIAVNVASQMLYLFSQGEEILRSKVITGKPETPTPEFQTVVTGVKINPDWNAPRGGGLEARYNDLIRKGNLEVFETYNIQYEKRSDGTYRIYQPAGPDNVLGKVRFIMNNPYHMYIHDTNRPDLFGLETRAISNGCIRVENWAELTAELMNINTDELNDVISEGRTEIKNTRNIPVVVVYWTEELVDGTYYKHPDIYNIGDRSVLD